LLATLLATEARACDLPPPETGTVETASVAAVLDGETLKLADGRTVKLIGAKAPAAPLGWRGDDPWPFVEEAKEALEALASAKAIELRFGGSRTDRHGYLLAQAFIVTGASRLWLQEELVARGLIEGTVLNVCEGNARVYLNFAPDWRSDFTISIARKDAASFAAAGLDPQTLAGKRLRVRGWLAWRNGPMIEATHPDQIELLPAGGRAANDDPRQDRSSIAL
jgi:hypothetical protein